MSAVLSEGNSDKLVLAPLSALQIHNDLKRCKSVYIALWLRHSQTNSYSWDLVIMVEGRIIPKKENVTCCSKIDFEAMPSSGPILTNSVIALGESTSSALSSCANHLHRAAQEKESVWNCVFYCEAFCHSSISATPQRIWLWSFILGTHKKMLLHILAHVWNIFR